MQDPKNEAQFSRKREDLSKEISAWRVKLRRARYARSWGRGAGYRKHYMYLSHQPDGKIYLSENVGRGLNSEF